MAARDAGPFRPAARRGRRGKNLSFDSYFNFIGSWWHGKEPSPTNKNFDSAQTGGIPGHLITPAWRPAKPVVILRRKLGAGSQFGKKMRPTRPKKGKQGEHRVSGPCRGPNDTPGPPTGTQCVALTCHCTPRGFLWGVSPAPVWPSKSAHGRGNFYR